MPGPTPGTSHEHRRQQQREQEEDVVESDPDVPHVVACVVAERGPEARRGKLHDLLAMVRREDGGLRAPRVIDPRQALVLAVEVEEELVADVQGGRRRDACAAEAQHGIAAAGVLVDEMLADFHRTGIAVRREAEPGERMGGDVGVAGAEFDPRDRTVLVGIDTDREVEIAQREVPLDVDDGVAHLQGEMAVARLVGEGERADQRQQDEEEDPGTDVHTRPMVDGERRPCLQGTRPGVGIGRRSDRASAPQPQDGAVRHSSRGYGVSHGAIRSSERVVSMHTPLPEKPSARHGPRFMWLYAMLPIPDALGRPTIRPTPRRRCRHR